VDGSARVQTVTRDQNPRFWELIKAFEELTGVAVLLNTSFNTSVEPIVRTAGEALLTFLTTNLDYLFLDDWMVTKKEIADDRLLDLVPVLNINVGLSDSHTATQAADDNNRHKIAFTYTKGRCMSLSRSMHQALRAADGKKSFRDCGMDERSSSAGNTTSLEIMQLLEGRFVGVRDLNVIPCEDSELQWTASSLEGSLCNSTTNDHSA
jgi:hypothetical protein